MKKRVFGRGAAGTVEAITLESADAAITILTICGIEELDGFALHHLGAGLVGDAGIEEVATRREGQDQRREEALATAESGTPAAVGSPPGETPDSSGAAANPTEPAAASGSSSAPPVRTATLKNFRAIWLTYLAYGKSSFAESPSKNRPPKFIAKATW